MKSEDFYRTPFYGVCFSEIFRNIERNIITRIMKFHNRSHDMTPRHPTSNFKIRGRFQEIQPRELLLTENLPRSVRKTTKWIWARSAGRRQAPARGFPPAPLVFCRRLPLSALRRECTSGGDPCGSPGGYSSSDEGTRNPLTHQEQSMSQSRLTDDGVGHTRCLVSVDSSASNTTMHPTDHGRRAISPARHLRSFIARLVYRLVDPTPMGHHGHDVPE